MTENQKLFIFLAAAYITLNLGLGSWGLTETSEARYAEISREMMLNNDYINPTLLDIYHYHKPPITYYITILGYQLFGINEFGARFFLPVAIILQLVLIFLITRLLFSNKKLPLMAAMIYFSFPVVLISSRNLTTDAYLTTSIIAALYFWLSYIRKNNGLWALYAFYICMGVAFEIKGPVSLLFIVVFIATYRYILREKFKKTIHQILGFMVFLIISGSWFVEAIMCNNSLLDYLVNHQLINRITNQSFNRAKPIWYYALLLPLSLFPWMFFGFNKIGSRIKRLMKARNEKTVLFISSLILLILFSLFKTKLILYILPCFWMFSILIAHSLQFSKPKSMAAIKILYLILGVFFLVGTIIVYDTKILFSSNGSQVFITFVLVLALFMVFFHLDKGSPQSTAVMAVAFSFVLIFFGVLFMKNNDSQIYSIKNVSAFIQNQNPSDDKNVLVYNYLLNSAPFYINGRIITLNDGHNTSEREVQFQKNTLWKKNLVDLKSKEEQVYLDSLLSSSKRKNFLLIRKGKTIRDSMLYLKTYFQKEKDFGNWILYY